MKAFDEMTESDLEAIARLAISTSTVVQWVCEACLPDIHKAFNAGQPEHHKCEVCFKPRKCYEVLC
jgi:hypothetical protein